MSDREQLARLLDPDAWSAREEDQHTLGSQFNFVVRRMDSSIAAQRAIDAGWRPPPRVIETVEELEASPMESVVQVIAPAEDPEEPAAIVWVQGADAEWVEPGSADRHPASEVNLPVWLLWSPPEKARPAE